MARPRTKVEIQAAAFRIKTVRHRERLDQGRFSGTIFADEKGDRRVQLHAPHFPDGGDGERVILKRRYAFAIEGEAGQKGRGLHDLRENFLDGIDGISGRN